MVVRSRSALGLKYLEINKGKSDEGFAEGSTIPLAAATPEPVELDKVLNTFDEPTRRRSSRTWSSSATRSPAAARRSTRRSGRLPGVLELLQPVTRNLASPSTGLGPVRRRAGRHRGRGGAGRRGPGAAVRRPRHDVRRARRRRPAVHPGVDLRGPADRARPRSGRCRGSGRFLANTTGLFADLAARRPRRCSRTRRRIAAGLEAGTPILLAPTSSTSSSRRRPSRCCASTTTRPPAPGSPPDHVGLRRARPGAEVHRPGADGVQLRRRCCSRTSTASSATATTSGPGSASSSSTSRRARTARAVPVVRDRRRRRRRQELPAREPVSEHRLARPAEGVRGGQRAVHRRPHRDRQSARQPGHRTRRGQRCQGQPKGKGGCWPRPAGQPRRRDPRIYGRHYTGPSPWVVGPDRRDPDRDRRLPRVHEEDPVHERGLPAARDVRERGHPAPDLAGADRRRQRRRGDLASSARATRPSVTFTVDDEGQPIHEDATIEIRPRLFLEGNFFLDLDPGSPSSPELADGRHDPGHPDRDRRPDRRGAHGAPGAGAQGPAAGALRASAPRSTTSRPPPRTSRQDPDVQGKTARRGAQQALRYGGPAGRDTAIVNEALLGEGPHDLSGLIAAKRQRVRQARGPREPAPGPDHQLQRLHRRARRRVDEPERDDRELAPTVEQARPSLAALSDALPPFRALARELDPEHRGAAGDDPGGRPVARPGRAAVSQGRARRARRRAARSRPRRSPRPRSRRRGCSRQSGRSATACRTTWSRPATSIDRRRRRHVPVRQGRRAPSGVTNFREFFSVLVNQTGAGQGFDGNGTYLRANRAAATCSAARRIRRAASATRPCSATTRATTSAPARPSRRRRRRPAPTSPCASNPLPDLNGAGGSGLPGDVGAAATSDGGAVRRAIREHLRDFIAIAALLFAGLLVTGYILSQQQQPYPSWVPFLGDDRFELKAEFSTAQAVTPGPGPDGEHLRRQGRRRLRGRARGRPRRGDDADRASSTRR